MTAHHPILNRKPRGFAAIFSIALIILVGTTLVIMGSYFAAEAKRTRAAKADAQLRQLLTAGAAVAIQRIQHRATDDAVALPATLAEGAAALSVHLSGEGDERTATISARLGERHVELTLNLNRSNERWHVR